MADTTNLTWGIWRRLWTGFVHGNRINSVSEAAECLFWRIHKPADDLGNFSANFIFLKSECAPRRKWSAAKIQRLLMELVDAKLVTLYEVDGETFGHIMEFQDRQPLGYDEHRNKRKPIQRYPLPPIDGKNEDLRMPTKANEQKRKLRPEAQSDKQTKRETDQAQSDSETNANDGAGLGEKFLGVNGTDGTEADGLTGRKLRALQRLQDIPFSKRTKSHAAKMLLALSDPLKFIVDVESKASSQGLAGDARAGYVYNAIKSESQEARTP